jgi:hypothetical protein
MCFQKAFIPFAQKEVNFYLPLIVLADFFYQCCGKNNVAYESSLYNEQALRHRRAYFWARK